jgi:hypothetical protein
MSVLSFKTQHTESRLKELGGSGFKEVYIV